MFKKLIVIFSFALLLSACKDIKDDPISFVTYNPFVLDGEKFDKKYSVLNKRGYRSVEFIRGFENFKTWTKLIAVRYQQLPLINNSPLDAAKNMLSLAKRVSPKISGRIIVNKEKNEAVVEFGVVPPGKRYVEYNFFRYVKNRSKNGLVSVQFAKRLTSKNTSSKKEMNAFRKSWLDQIVKFDMREAGSYVGQL